MLRKATMDDFTFVHELYMHPEINPHLLYERQEKREFEPIWGRGYGVQMLQEALKWAKSEGFHRVELSVGSKNIAAKNLYLRLGFEHEGVMKDYSFLKSENRYIDEDLMSYMVPIS